MLQKNVAGWGAGFSVVCAAGTGWASLSVQGREDRREMKEPAIPHKASSDITHE
jgi:hypothetical protein